MAATVRPAAARASTKGPSAARVTTQARIAIPTPQAARPGTSSLLLSPRLRQTTAAGSDAPRRGSPGPPAPPPGVPRGQGQEARRRHVAVRRDEHDPVAVAEAEAPRHRALADLVRARPGPAHGLDQHAPVVGGLRRRQHEGPAPRAAREPPERGLALVGPERRERAPAAARDQEEEAPPRRPA